MIVQGRSVTVESKGGSVTAVRRVRVVDVVGDVDGDVDCSDDTADLTADDEDAAGCHQRWRETARESNMMTCCCCSSCCCSRYCWLVVWYGSLSRLSRDTCTGTVDDMDYGSRRNEGIQGVPNDRSRDGFQNAEDGKTVRRISKLWRANENHVIQFRLGEETKKRA